MKSRTLNLYKDWLKTATPAQIKLVDAIYSECELNYERGGDVIVECFTPEEVLKEFKSKKEVKRYCGVRVENALNYRQGNDDDPELQTAKAFKQWQKDTD